MKSLIFKADEFDQEKFLKEHAGQTVEVKLNFDDGTHMRTAFSPNGVEQTVGQFRETLAKVPDDNPLKKLKLSSIKNFPDAMEIVIPSDQMATLMDAMTPPKLNATEPVVSALEPAFDPGLPPHLDK